MNAQQSVENYWGTDSMNCSNNMKLKQMLIIELGAETRVDGMHTVKDC